MTLKLFVGNLADSIEAQQLRQLFGQYGECIDCDVLRNYAFVHMKNEEEGRLALDKLNEYILDGMPLKVEMAKSNRPMSDAEKTLKIYVGNLSEQTRTCQIEQMFSKFGTIKECDVIEKNYGFVHLTPFATVQVDDILQLNGTVLNERPIKVQLSISRIRPKPGMGSPEQCFRCGSKGHWSKECPRLQQPRAPKRPATEPFDFIDPYDDAKYIFHRHLHE